MKKSRYSDSQITVQYDWLNQYLFESIHEVQEFATKWLWVYNNERSYTAIGGIGKDLLVWI